MCALNVGDNFSDSGFHNLNMGITFDPGNYTDNQKTAFGLLWNCKKAINQGGDVDPQASIEIVRLYGELHYESYRGRKIGRKPRIDKLQERILEIVKIKPEITEKNLLLELENEKNLGVIEDVDDEAITFIDKKGKSKTAPITGLKDRLSGAKKRLKSP
mgnify:FL=1